MTVDCAEDIDRYTRYLEKLNKIPADFLSLKVGGVDGRMRQILVDWLIHVRFISNELASISFSGPIPVPDEHRNSQPRCAHA